MRRILLLGTVTLLACAVAWGQFRVVALNPTGELTWTNSVTNATYGIRWARSPIGPWNPFDIQTNLNSIKVATNRVTVPVPPPGEPTFYRVAWSDAPAYAGQYAIREHDTNGTLMVTGSLWLAGEHGSLSSWGTRALYQVYGPTNYPGPQLGPGTIFGAFTASIAYLKMNLTPYYVDNNVTLTGFLVGNAYRGFWEWNTGGLSPIHHGAFTAVRINADNPLPPNALGSWVYQTYHGVYVTGLLAFATSTIPLTGNWAFANKYPGTPTTHLLGEGALTKAVLTVNNLVITIAADTNIFILDGEMAGDFYAGFFQRESNESEKGIFLARRAVPP